MMTKMMKIFTFFVVIIFNIKRKDKNMKVKDNEVFGIPTESFAVSPSSTGYTLNYSADGQNFTAWEEDVPAGEVLVVNGFAHGMGFKLEGNVGEVFVQF